MPFRIKLTLVLLLSLLTLLLVAPLFTPVRPLPDTVTETALADPDSRFIRVNDLNVHYKTSSLSSPEEPAFVLLHGFGASTYSWSRVLDEFGTLGRTVAFDRPAFGLTERPLEWTGENPYSFQAQVNLSVGLMNELDIGRAVLVGNSAGAAVAVGVARDHPERVAGLILIDAAIYAQRSGLATLLNRTPQMNRVGPLLMRQMSGEPGLEVLRSAWSDPEKLDEATVEAYRTPLQANDWDKALWEASRAQTPRLEPVLPTLNMPALVITGQDDTIIPPEQSERLANDLPNATFAAFESCGHVPQEECPAPLMDVVRTWLIDEGLVGGEPK